MEQTAELQVNLFREQLPSMDETRNLSHLVHASEANQHRFAEQVEQNLNNTSALGSLEAGIGLFILGRYKEALPKLQKGQDCKEKYMYLAFTQRQLRKFDEALQSLQKAKEAGAEAFNVSLEKAATQRHAGNLEAAAKELQACANFDHVSAEYHYQLARLREAQGEYDKAIGNYKVALELAPTHQRALFHLAYRYDLSGMEDEAVEYYKEVVASAPVYVSALLNLAVLYEDRGEFEKASACVDKPSNPTRITRAPISFTATSRAPKSCSTTKRRRKRRAEKTRF